MLPSPETSVNRNPPERLSRRDPIRVLGPRRLVRGPKSLKAGPGLIYRIRTHTMGLDRDRPFLERINEVAFLAP